jgi:hypothetical protein
MDPKTCVGGFRTHSGHGWSCGRLDPVAIDPQQTLVLGRRRFFFSDLRLGATMEVGRINAVTRPIHLTQRHSPFALRLMGKISMRLLDLTMAFVVAAYFLKYVDSRCVLNAFALA